MNRVRSARWGWRVAVSLLGVGLLSSLLNVFGIPEARAFSGTVRTGICQIESIDGDVPGNLARVDNCIQQLSASGADIVVLSELVDVGFGSIVTAPTGAEHARAIPGETSDALGALAVKYDVWIAGALLEAVPGGSYDTSVMIDNKGKVVLKQRKAFVYPVFGGAKAFQGNYQDAILVDSPWGPIGVMNCADTALLGKIRFIAQQKPALMLVNLANPQATLMANANIIAQECNCPVAATNMYFPSGASGMKGGKSVFIDANGTTLWQATNSGPAINIWDMSVNSPSNRKPEVSIDEAATIRFPANSVSLSGRVVDEGMSGNSVSLSWSKVSGPGTVTFSSPNNESTNAAFSAPGFYTLRLSANDGSLSGSGDVSVSVLPATGELNLVGYWNFNNTASDSSGNNNNGTLVGNPTYSTDTAPIGGSQNTGSLDLDGNGDYVQVPHNSSLSAPDAVTISLWMKPRSYPGFFPTGNDWSSLIAKSPSWGSANYHLGFGAYFYLHSDSMGVRIPSLDDRIRTPNQWHHVALVINKYRSEGKIYVNGVLDHKIYNVTTLGTNTAPLYIGTYAPSATTIDGKIDEVRVYSRSLSDDEIAALAGVSVINQKPTINAGQDITVSSSNQTMLQGSYSDDQFPSTSNTAHWTYWRKASGPGYVSFDNAFALAPTASFSQRGTYVLELRGSDGGNVVTDTVTVLVTNQASSDALAHWTLDETNGTTASDSAGTNPGTLVNGPVWMPTGGKIAGALSFDGINDYVNAGSTSLFNLTGDLTVAGWVYHDDSAGADIVASKGCGQVGVGCPWQLRVDGADNACFDQADAAGTPTALCSSGSRVTLNTWKHLAMVRSGTDRSIYVDGALAAGPIPQGSTPAANNMIMTIGENLEAGGGNFWDGLLDDIRLYNRALSATEIQALATPPGLRGDLDGDGTVDLDDIRTMIYMLIGQVPPNLATADLDGDGQLTLADIRELINSLVSP